MSELTQMMCVPCRGGEPPLDVREISELGRETPGWNVIEVEGIKRLERVFKFKNFVEALDFTRRIGELAESQGHHPALLTEYGKVTVTWWTHKIRGLHKNDFIMSARTTDLYDSLRAA
ncbi:MAG TPA: 4a-hydroxytetrahydrobiopterin dehydratase [Anaerolineales bacterium]|nr:4a-hydroxytetrahydrobiopterin dehydratase [Anaerolineales bacterium]